MARKIVEPTIGEHGEQLHPAWGMIGMSRVGGTPGAVLFDSDVRHGHYVVVRLSRGARKRELHRDWLYAREEIIEIAMSEAQWASFVSSANIGTGVPCTILHEGNDWEIPGMPFEPRLQESMDEVRDAAQRAQEKVQDAFAAYEEHETVGNLRNLKYAIENMPSNITFAAESLSEHAENVVQKARADIEAMVVQKAQQLGLEAGDLDIVPGQLTEGEAA